MPNAIIPPLNGRRPTTSMKAWQVDRSHDWFDRRPLLHMMKKSGPLGSAFHGDSLWISINLRHLIPVRYHRDAVKVILNANELIVEKKRQVFSSF